MEAVASDGPLEGAQDVVGVVVGAGNVGGLAVASEGDRAWSAPRSEVIACLLEVGVGGEPEPVGVVGGSKDEVADEFDRRGDGRRVISAKDGLSSRFGGESSVRELDLDAGAAEVDHRDQRVGGVESVRAV